ncbi:hypothetical protein HHL22_08630 [Hymenobacter sp. RP-2-7]|uniref:Uncharacterized protein n=1 Tax=Hymenobacter polaris TaxID=2682546 RepID=A0A7Y0ADN2_9BACT|nr:hypothetical protein [Hymenobacter polaris]NML65267.1 hypothetical protein [Hymenobacter polaris]
MSTDDHFLIGVSLVDPAADPIVLEFQQELYQADRVAVRAPRGLYQQLGAAAFAEHVADYYLAEHPAEAVRVGRAAVVQAVQDAIAWGPADSRHPQGLL